MQQQNKIKELGQVYTPLWIVEEILDRVEYKGENILRKYILEPSCGDGAFLCKIVERYINVARNKNLSDNQIIQDLEKYIYGVEIDEKEYEKCIDNLNRTLLTNGINQNISWNIFNANTLNFYTDYLDFFDYIVGNPPYVRIHNLDQSTRNLLKQKFVFSVGTIDIYLAFFEMAFYMLKSSSGKLGFITPNSFLHNASYERFREYLKQQKKLKIIVDLKSNKVFHGFSTYTAITIIDNKKNDDYFEYNELLNDKIKFLNKIKFDSLNSRKWTFSNYENALFLDQLFEDKNTLIKDLYNIQYGFATLRDKIFIGEILDIDEQYGYFNGYKVEKSLFKKIVKGSTYKGNPEEIAYVLFPYEKIRDRYRSISENILIEKYPFTYEYLKANKEELIKRDMDKGSQWFEFGRSQGIQTIHQEKIILSTLVNNKISYYKLPEDIFLYSGIFITLHNSNLRWDIIEDVLSSEDFYRYIKITGKDFSGGYKSISTKQIKEYKIKYKRHQTLF